MDSVLQQLPAEAEVLDNEKFCRQVVRSLHAEHLMRDHSNPNVILRQQQLTMSHFDATQSLFAYQALDNGGDLKLRFLLKNTAAYARSQRFSPLEGEGCDCVREAFSVVNIVADKEAKDAEVVLELSGCKPEG